MMDDLKMDDLILDDLKMDDLILDASRFLIFSFSTTFGLLLRHLCV